MADVSVDVHSDGVAVDSEVVVKGLDDIRAETTLHSDGTVTAVTTLSADSTARLAVEPLAVTSAATVGVDLQPVAVDTCLRIELAPPPPTVVRTPWESRLGLSWFGIELVAVSFSGELRSQVEPAARLPQLLGTVEQVGHRGPTEPAAGVTVRLGP